MRVWTLSRGSASQRTAVLGRAGALAHSPLISWLPPAIGSPSLELAPHVPCVCACAGGGAGRPAFAVAARVAEGACERSSALLSLGTSSSSSSPRPPPPPSHS